MSVCLYLRQQYGGVQMDDISASFTYTLWKTTLELALHDLGFANQSYRLDGYALSGMALEV
jgi:hypothetical protein